MIRLPNEDDNRVVLSEGPHLFEVLAVAVTHLDDKSVMKLRYRVLAGPSPAGTQGVEEFHMSPKAIKRITILGKRLGLIERGRPELELEIDEQGFVGKQVVAVIEHESFQSRAGNEVTKSKWKGFEDFWAPDDERSPLKPNTFAAPGTRPAAHATPAVTDWSNV